MCFLAEVYLLEAVRDVLRDELTLTANQCDCEPYEVFPQTAGDEYVAVIPASMEIGPTQNTSGGVFDVMHAFTVSVMHRVGDVPRDRRRTVFLNHLAGLGKRLDDVVALLNWKINACGLATNRLQADFPGSEKFTELPRVTRMDTCNRNLPQEAIGAKSSPNMGATPVLVQARAVTFGRCRRITTIGSIS